MSNENNKRYLGEVFIDGESDQLLQTFLTNLFNSYNGRDKGFNADMLDDWHLKDITQYVDERTSSKLESITIGESIFSMIDSSKYLQLSDVIYNIFQNPEKAPWIDYLTNRIEEKEREPEDKVFERENSTGLSNDKNYLLNDMILDIYYALDLSKIDEDTYNILKADHDNLQIEHDLLREDYDSFKESFDDSLQTVSVTDNQGNTVEKTFLNAQLINGFRIIPITQEAYDELPDAEKNLWRNIYIIRDSVPDEYIDPVAFNVLKDIEIKLNQETQYLEYYDGFSDTPTKLCSLADILVGANFGGIIDEHIAETSDIIYNLDAIKETIKQLVIEQEDLDDIPFLTRDESSTLVSDIISEYGDIITEGNESGFQTLDITHAYDNIFGEDLGEKTIKEQFEDINNSLSNLSLVVEENDETLEATLKDYVGNYTANNYTKTDVINQQINEAVRDIRSEFNSAINQLQSSVNVLANQYYNNSLRVNIYRTYDYNNTSEYKPLLDIQHGIHAVYAKITCDKPNFDLKNRQVYFYIQGRYYLRTTDENGISEPLNINIESGTPTVMALVRGEDGVKNAIDIKVLNIT